MWFAMDVRAILGSVQAPSLVLCRPAAKDNAAHEVRYLAERIPGARYGELSGEDYVLTAGDLDEFFGVVDAFLTTISDEQADIARVLTTVLFTDIVGSTERAAGVGDRAWGAVVERHHEVVRALLGRYRGVEVDTAGDGFFATFDGPARAVRCARAIIEGVRSLGIEIRAGVHTGEVETVDRKVGGIAVSIGARIGALADPSQVLVSSTVKDLTAGSGIVFEDQGEHELKGVPDGWHLYRVTP